MLYKRFNIELNSFKNLTAVEEIEQLIMDNFPKASQDMYMFCVSIDEIIQNAYLHSAPKHTGDDKILNIDLFIKEHGDTLIVICNIRDNLKKFDIVEAIYKNEQCKKNSIAEASMGGWGLHIIKNAKIDILFSHEHYGNNIMLYCAMSNTD